MILLIFVLSISRFVRDLKIDVYFQTAHEKGQKYNVLNLVLASEVIFRPGTIQVNICIYVYPRQCKIFCSINNLKIYF